MANLGAHPRLAAMLLSAANPVEAATAADLAALLEERDPLRGRDAPADIESRLLAIRHGDANADRGALSRIRQTARQYRRRLRVPPDLPGEADAGRLLAAAFPDRIAQRRGEPGSFRLSGGGGARLPPTDRLARDNLLVVAAIDPRVGARIQLAAPLDADDLPAVLTSRMTEHTETSFDASNGTVLARRRRRLGTLILSDRTIPVDPADIAATLADAVAGQALKPLPWTDTTRQFQARVALMRGLEPDSGWPDLSDTTLTLTARDWLTPYLNGLNRVSELANLDLLAILRGQCPWPLPNRLDSELPTQIALPRGRVVVDYQQPVPVASARAQHFYGCTETPRLAGGRVPLRLALLSPAGRPIAVTGDLAAFWKGAWADARRDMRGRYPKHDWPEDGGSPDQ